ncbi:hypothetical protein EJ05DRAFT_479954 [Pseudovirgaria hyperparasitica]|uniref:Uncharacterized protein n=1 Tax=Pseudovirgaria hyperparasitica TaxID=470096 RepID=A0A6A6VVN9_9PEZI|nr:uncharacterized protein EJ05DRAFT_479954 [Pseudovirgaria hyperparasitica]KAF2753929.1 hypothetical protein EJ05DRAFT_479954 [Pseudovirgaria hyperparasitica]
MGGQLFCSGPNALNVPRLAPDLYQKLKAQYTDLLRQYYSKVTTPVEAPGKASHGDIDMMVASPLHDLAPPTLAAILDAARHSTSGPTTSFAVPHPEDPTGHVQLDVHVCVPEHLAWEAFEHSYGDLWQIIGVCIRPLGLTTTNKGFFLRIPELEHTDRKGSLIFLTEEPSEALQFLGLDAAAYETGFATEEDLFAWIVDAGFFGVEELSTRDNAKDRQRRAKREMFVRFVDEFVGARMGQLRVSPGPEWTRDAVLARGLERFGRREEYDTKMAGFFKHEKEKAFWAKAARMVPVDEGEKLNLVMRGLKRWVSFEQDEAVINAEADMSDDPVSKWANAIDDIGEEKLLAWIEDNWEEVRTKEKSRVKRAKMERAEVRGLTRSGEVKSED